METSEIADATLSDQAAVLHSKKGWALHAIGTGHEEFSRIDKSFYKNHEIVTVAFARQQVEEYVQYCRDYKDIEVLQLSVHHKTITFKGQRYELSDTAIANIASLGGVAIAKRFKSRSCNPGYRALRAYYVRPDINATEIFDRIADDFLTHIKDKRVLIRTYENGSDRRIDAILTDRYGIIDNLWFLDVLAKHVVGGFFSRFHSTGRTISGYYFIPDAIRTEFPDYGGALGIRNSEIGKSSLIAQPSVFDWISRGGYIFGEYYSEAMRRVHRGNIDMAELEEALLEHINAQIPLLNSCVQQLEELKKIALDTNIMRKVITDVGSQRNLTQEEQRMWLAGIEAEIMARGLDFGKSALGMVAGLVRASQNTESFGRDMELDTLAGQLATPDRRDRGDIAKSWERIASRASTVSDEKVDKVFANIL